MTRDRAVSDVIGFVLVFAIVMATVGLATTVGLGGLEDARDAEQVNNAERAFDILADNQEDIYRRGAPARATGIKLAGADLRFGAQTTINVTIDGNDYYRKSLDPIVYDAGGPSRIVYEGGAVVRSDRGGAVMLRSPELLFTEQAGSNVTVVPIVQTRGTGSSSVGGETTVLVRTKGVTSDLLVERTDPTTTHEVNLTITTTEARAVAWERHLEEQVPDRWSGSDVCQIRTGGRVTCTFESDEVYVSRTGISTSFT